MLDNQFKSLEQSIKREGKDEQVAMLALFENILSLPPLTRRWLDRSIAILMKQSPRDQDYVLSLFNRVAALPPTIQGWIEQRIEEGEAHMELPDSYEAGRGVTRITDRHARS